MKTASSTSRERQDERADIVAELVTDRLEAEALEAGTAADIADARAAGCTWAEIADALGGTEAEVRARA
jgi:hypothetical protein